MNGSVAEHIPVLGKTLAERISLPTDGIMVDATIGHGGHGLLFGQNLGPDGTIVGLDVDNGSIRRAHFRLQELSCKVILICENFSKIGVELGKRGIEKVDLILADLGLCSAHLEDSGKGLSFQTNMALDMRIDQRLKRTAADIVNSADEKSLADLIYRLGQERASRRIARYIVRARRSQAVKTTGELASIVCKALGRREGKGKSRIHPATRTFQALRIAVNNELENLESFLAVSAGLLKQNGQIAIISYHSLEDRIVKTNFRQNEREGIYRVITKRPLVASREEIASNRRARSAKLRIASRK